MRSLLLFAAVTLLAGCGHAPLVTSAAPRAVAAEQTIAKGCYCGGGGSIVAASTSRR